MRALEHVTGHELLPDDFLHLEDHNRYCNRNFDQATGFQITFVYLAGKTSKQWRKSSDSIVLGRRFKLKRPGNCAGGGDIGLVMYWKYLWLGSCIMPIIMLNFTFGCDETKE